MIKYVYKRTHICVCVWVCNEYIVCFCANLTVMFIYANRYLRVCIVCYLFKLVYASSAVVFVLTGKLVSVTVEGGLVTLFPALYVLSSIPTKSLPLIYSGLTKYSVSYVFSSLYRLLQLHSLKIVNLMPKLEIIILFFITPLLVLTRQTYRLKTFQARQSRLLLFCVFFLGFFVCFFVTDFKIRNVVLSLFSMSLLQATPSVRQHFNFLDFLFSFLFQVISIWNSLPASVKKKKHCLQFKKKRNFFFTFFCICPNSLREKL